MSQIFVIGLMVFTKNLTLALGLAKGITLNFVMGLMVFTKNLRPFLSLATNITLSLPLMRLIIDAKSLRLYLQV